MFIVLEFQTDAAGTTVVAPPLTYATLNEAKSKYHLILSSAAVSSVVYHAAAIMYSNGNLIESECFEHIPEPTPEEPEATTETN